MKYIVKVGEREFGPSYPAELERALSKGTISWDTMVREENSTEWNPLQKILPSLVPYQSSALASIFTFLAIIDLIGGVVGVVLMFSDRERYQMFGFPLLIAGFAGGLTLLALAKILECLHEMVFRLRYLETVARRHPNNPLHGA